VGQSKTAPESSIFMIPSTAARNAISLGVVLSLRNVKFIHNRGCELCEARPLSNKYGIFWLFLVNLHEAVLQEILSLLLAHTLKQTWDLTNIFVNL